MHLNSFAVREPAIRFEAPTPFVRRSPQPLRPVPYRPRRELALTGAE
jgi:hypothetical protein